MPFLKAKAYQEVCYKLTKNIADAVDAQIVIRLEPNRLRFTGLLEKVGGISGKCPSVCPKKKIHIF